MSVYAAEWCDCVHESAFGIVSLHKTKRGAYLAMRHKLWEQALEEREMQLSGYPEYRARFTAASVRAIEVLP